MKLRSKLKPKGLPLSLSGKTGPSSSTTSLDMAAKSENCDSGLVVPLKK